MIAYQEACKIAKKELEEYFETFNEITVTEIEEGWVFVFGKTGVDLTPAPSRLVVKETGEVRCFSIPPIAHLKKLKNGKKIEFLDQ